MTADAGRMLVKCGCHSLQSRKAGFRTVYTRWFIYDRDYLCVNKSQFVPVLFEPPCSFGDSVLDWCNASALL